MRHKRASSMDSAQACNGGTHSVDAELTLPHCIVCAAATTKWFSIGQNGSAFHYCRCPICGHLTATELAAPIRYDDEKYFNNVDTGWQERNATIFMLVRSLLRSSRFGLSYRSIVLDYGCGVGHLVNDLSLAGFNAWGFEPYALHPGPMRRVLTSWQDVTRTVPAVELLACIEVLEHLPHPDRFLNDVSGLIKSDGYILVSTGMFRKGFHSSDWYYLNPAAGHVSIFTEESLRLLLARHQFEPVLRASEIAWLFRKKDTHTKDAAEERRFLLSQARVRTKIEIADIARTMFGPA
jgi:2-polyprenyl-3-methyl-5-hydroxy-6-metoxy-1,4-benzoquinol methylase